MRPLELFTIYGMQDFVQWLYFGNSFLGLSNFFSPPVWNVPILDCGMFRFREDSNNNNFPWAPWEHWPNCDARPSFQAPFPRLSKLTLKIADVFSFIFPTFRPIFTKYP